MDRNTIIDAIESMDIYERDYDTLMYLMNNASPRLFTKIMEEIFLGNFFISDFESILSDTKSTQYNELIQDEYELWKELQALTAFRSSSYKQYDYSTKSDILSFTKDNVMSSLFVDIQDDSSLKKEIRLAVYNKMLSSGNKDIILSGGDFLVPIAYENVLLDDYDKHYMQNNGLSAIAMRKLKAICLYLEEDED